MPLAQLIVADDPAALESGLDALAELDVVGVDVERADWDRYFRSPALLQVGGAGLVAVIDPLTLDDLSPLQEFLEQRRAVFHAIENDLAPLASCDVIPPQVEDTAIAAALLGLPTGLGALLAEVLGVTLEGDKAAMQRSDWEARPLSQEMIAYAAGDVADLPRLWAVLEERLDEAGRRPWYDEELWERISQPPAEDRRVWHRVKGVGRLDAAARARMQALWTARERLARRTDTAPNRIVGDKVLVDLATRPPAGTRELGRRGMRRQAVRDFGEALLEAIAHPLEALEPDRRRRASDADRAAADRLRTLRADIAARLGIDAGVLCPSRVLLSAVLTDPADGEELRRALGLRRWQWEQVGPAFCQALSLSLSGTAQGEGDDD